MQSNTVKQQLEDLEELIKTYRKKLKKCPISGRRCQYLYFCTSKASKVSPGEGEFPGTEKVLFAS
jgi:hypothetical protein